MDPYVEWFIAKLMHFMFQATFIILNKSLFSVKGNKNIHNFDVRK